MRNYDSSQTASVGTVIENPSSLIEQSFCHLIDKVYTSIYKIIKQTKAACGSRDHKVTTTTTTTKHLISSRQRIKTNIYPNFAFYQLIFNHTIKLLYI